MKPISFQVISELHLEGEKSYYDAVVAKGKRGEIIVDDLELAEESYNLLTRVKRPVFELGEILIVDADSEREIAPPMRKAYKWNVNYKKFDSLEEAIKYSRSITKGR